MGKGYGYGYTRCFVLFYCSIYFILFHFISFNFITFYFIAHDITPLCQIYSNTHPLTDSLTEKPTISLLCDAANAVGR